MFNQKNLETIKKLVEEFFEKMGFGVELGISFSGEETVSINLNTKKPEEAGILIGEKGETLFEIQYLLKAISRRKIGKNFPRSEIPPKAVIYLDLDINDYKKRKIEYLKELARSIAKEVVITGREKELPPMSASERRIIHLDLAEKLDVTTQSIGKEPQRRVVIRPYP